MNIKPISDLRNYNKVLKDCKAGSPVFLTKNGRGKYVIMDIEQYETIMAEIKLINKILNAEEKATNDDPYMSISELKTKLGI